MADIELTEEEIEYIQERRKNQTYRDGVERGFREAAFRIQEISLTSGGGAGVVSGEASMYIEAILKLDANNFKLSGE